MDQKSRTSASKFLSLVLRHRPEVLGLELDESGWADVDDLLERCASRNRRMTRDQLDEIVAKCPKQRFALSADGARIRASQGHSVNVDLGYRPAPPPDVLFHGAPTQVLPSIRQRGLVRMTRHHVHLSPDEITAAQVGGRRGKAVILRVDAARMHRDGHLFYCSTNGVWLTDEVPPDYISGLDED